MDNELYRINETHYIDVNLEIYSRVAITVNTVHIMFLDDLTITTLAKAVFDEVAKDVVS